MKPIYKRKWFLIAAGIGALMVLGIITNLTESEEPAPMPTVRPAPTATRVPMVAPPTPTRLEQASTDFDDAIRLVVYNLAGWTPTDRDFERFCANLAQDVGLVGRSLDIGLAVVAAAIEAGMDEDESEGMANTWCQNR